MSSELIDIAERSCLKSDVPEFHIGDTVEVSCRMKETFCGADSLIESSGASAIEVQAGQSISDLGVLALQQHQSQRVEGQRIVGMRAERDAFCRGQQLRQVRTVRSGLHQRRNQPGPRMCLFPLFKRMRVGSRAAELKRDHPVQQIAFCPHVHKL